MKTDSEKLAFILRAIVTAGGPDQPKDMADEVYLLMLTNWLLRQGVPPPPQQPYTDAVGTCGCKVTTQNQ